MSASPWKTLLRKALRLMGSLEDSPLEQPVWSLGGGTMLMLDYGHRSSRDIDIFIRDAQYIAALSPRINDIADSLSASNYDEQSNYLKVRCQEGEIDIIVAPSLTTDCFLFWEFEGQTIRRETPLEIVAKKTFYRTATFRPRDLFDLAALFDHEPEAPGELRTLLGPEKRRSLCARIGSLLPVYEARVAAEIDTLPAGLTYASRTAAASVVAALGDK